MSPLPCKMMNGIGWCMVDLYHNTDCKIPHHGPTWSPSSNSFDKPTAFWWESPAGNRLLAYRSEHYTHGNALSLTSATLMSSEPIYRNTSNHWNKKNYPFDHTAFNFLVMLPTTPPDFWHAISLKSGMKSTRAPNSGFFGQ